jgi:hypothetical protein
MVSSLQVFQLQLRKPFSSHYEALLTWPFLIFLANVQALCNKTGSLMGGSVFVLCSDNMK